MQVGPQSAGADPGPACYKQGGNDATVTDANLVLGRLRADSFLGGNMALDSVAARAVVESLAIKLDLSVEEMAEGIIELANEHMARALRVMSVQRGLDPRQLTLVSFGGAGGLHVCALADALAMRNAIVPVNAGVLSALGMLVAPRARHLSQSINVLMDTVNVDELQSLFETLAERGKQELQQEGLSNTEMVVSHSADVRYQGQSYTLNIPWQGKENTKTQFHNVHEQRYGHRLDQAVEIVTLRVVVQGKSEMVEDFENILMRSSGSSSMDFTEVELYGFDRPVRVYARDDLAVGQRLLGPLLITEKVSTTFVDRNWECCVDRVGNLLLEKAG